MRRWLVAIACLGSIVASAANGAADLPAGWRLEGDELVWTSSTPLHMGGARYEFRSGQRLLGYPRQSGDSLRLQRSLIDPLNDLSVWAAGTPH
jgi:hypothetical protein